jgi:hypothetical protein
MGRGTKIRRTLALAVMLALAWHGVRTVRGKVVLVSGPDAGGPVIKVRTLQVAPASMVGILGWGDVKYRAEFYPQRGAGKQAEIEFKEDSLFEGERVEVKWLPGDRAEVWMPGGPIFHWTGKEWGKWGLPQR